MSICRVTPSRVCELKSDINLKAVTPNEVTPSRVCELKYLPQAYLDRLEEVTPSRVCELKLYFWKEFDTYKVSHPHGCVSWNTTVLGLISPEKGHTLTGVWVEIADWATNTQIDSGHTLTGVWVEMLPYVLHTNQLIVTPSRVCELKSGALVVDVIIYGHTLTGVWVEIEKRGYLREKLESHPHGCVSWNNVWRKSCPCSTSHPHGCVSWNSRH